MVPVEALITAGSIAVAVVIAVYQLRKQREDRRIQHTVELLARTFDDGPVYRARREVRSWIIAGREITDDEVAPAEDDVIATTLNYYDFLASLVLSDSLDLDVVSQTFAGVMRRDTNYLRGYIDARRIRAGRPNLYRNLEIVCNDWFQHAD